MDHREHSLYFDDYNTWDMWHIVPTSRPTPTVPAPSTNFVEIPGRSGSLDLSEALTGYPVYKNRTIQQQFIVLDQRINWMDIYSDICAKLNGKRMKVKLIDDPDWYYEGRVTVNAFNSNSDFSSIDIQVECDPFKVSEKNTMVVFDDDIITPEESGDPYYTLNLSGIMSSKCQIVNPIMWINSESVDTQTINFTNTELNYTSNGIVLSSTRKEIDKIILSNFSGENTCTFTLPSYVDTTSIRLKFQEKQI